MSKKIIAVEEEVHGMCQGCIAHHTQGRDECQKYKKLFGKPNYLCRVKQTIFKEVEGEEEYHYYEYMVEDSLFPYKPIAVYVSDNSIEEGIAQKRITWLLGKTLKGDYLTWDECYSIIENLPKIINDNCTSYWKYATPVIKPTITVEEQQKLDVKMDLQKQLEEAIKIVEDVKKKMEEL